MPPVQESAEQLADELLANLTDLVRGDEHVAESARARIVAVVTPYLDAPALAAHEVKEAAASASTAAAAAAAEVLELRGRVSAAVAAIRSAEEELPDPDADPALNTEVDGRRETLKYVSTVLATIFPEVVE